MFAFRLFASARLGRANHFPADTSLLPCTLQGQGKVELAYNAHRHNLFVAQSLPPIYDHEFLTAPGFVYNSKGQPAWQLNCVSQLQIDDQSKLNSEGDVINLKRHDGAIVTFIYDEQTQCYRSQGLADGEERLVYEKDKGFTWQKSGTTTSVQYDVNGLLQHETNAHGQQRGYQFDKHNRLQKITLPSGAEIQFSYKKSQCLVSWQASSDAAAIPLAEYTFDNSHLTHLLKAKLYATDNAADAYEINYGYETSGVLKKRGLLNSITQTDGSKLKLNFNKDKQLAEVYQGDLSKPVTLTHTAGQCCVTEANNTQWQAQFDVATGLMQGLQKPVADANAYEITQFTYEGEHLQKAERVDQATHGVRSESWQYQAQGLIEQHDYAYSASMPNVAANTTANQTRYEYNAQGLTTAHIRVLVLADGSERLLTERFVYDAKGRLQFSVSAKGVVTQLAYDDDKGVLIEKRTYLNGCYQVDDTHPATAEAIYQWAQQLPSPAQIRLTKYSGHDAQGQVGVKTRYANINADGSGVEDAQTQTTALTHNRYHQVGRQTTTINQTLSGVKLAEHDNLARLTASESALHYRQETTYQNNQINTKHLSQGELTRTEQQTLNALGKQASHAITADDVTRQTDYAYDADRGCLSSINAADGTVTYVLYDAQHREQFHFDALGFATQFFYDEKGRKQQQVAYPKPLSIEAIKALKHPVDVTSLLAEVNTPAGERRATYLYDAADRLRYTIAPDGGLVENIYDTAGRCIGTIAYAKAFEGEPVLQDGFTLTLPADFVSDKDRHTHHFYDNDDHVIATQDAEGYLTLFTNNLAGEIIDECLYLDKLTSTQCDPHGRWNGVLPDVKPEREAHTYTLRDQLGLPTYVINAEGEVTCFERNAAGLIETETHYSIRFDIDKLKLADFDASKFVDDKDARSIHYEYDAAGNCVQELHANGLVVIHCYDAENKLLATLQQDSLAGTNDDPAKDNPLASVSLQDSFSHLDTWQQEQQALSANNSLKQGEQADSFRQAFLAAYQQGPSALKTLWATVKHAEGHEYDPQSGLRIKTHDAKGNTTVFYYNAKRQLTHEVDAEGGVKIYTYNAFDETPETETILGAALTEADRKQVSLHGGFLAAETEALLAEVATRKAAYNRTLTREFDLGGRVQTTTDGENFKISEYHDVFGDCHTRETDVGIAPTGEAARVKKETFEHDKRSKQTKSILISKDGMQSLIHEATYDALGKRDCQQAPDGTKTTWEHDRLGQKLTQTTAGKQRVLERYNTFGEKILETAIYDPSPAGADASAIANLATHYAYQQAGRTRVVTDPLQRSTTTHSDAFGQWRTRLLADGKSKEFYAYDGEGEVSQEQDPNGHLEIFERDENNWLIVHTDKSGTKTRYVHNNLGKIIDSFTGSNDGVNSELHVHHDYNPAQEIIATRDEAGYLTLFYRDRRGLVVADVLDPISEPRPSSALSATPILPVNRITLHQLDGEHKEQNHCVYATYDADLQPNEQAANQTSLMQTMLEPSSDILGERVKADDYLLTTNMNDDFHRPTGQTQDPHGLKIEALDTLNSKGKAIVHYGAAHSEDAPQVTLTIRDEFDNPCYNVAPDGTVTEYAYHLGVMQTHERLYFKKLDLPTLFKTTKPEQFTIGLMQTLTKDIANESHDELTYYLYNKDNEKTLKVKARDDTYGQLTEYVNDANGHPLLETVYSHIVELKDAVAAAGQSELLERPDISGAKTYATLHDGDGNLVYEVDPLGHVIKHINDGEGRLIQRIQYAKKFTNWSAYQTPSTIQQLSIAELNGYYETHTNAAEDRIEHQVRDNLGRVRFALKMNNGKHYVTEYRYDPRDVEKKVYERVYVNPLTTLPTQLTLENVIAAVKLIADPQKDEITDKIFDGGKREVFERNAEDAETHRTFTVADKPRQVCDPEGHLWSHGYDGVARETLATMPVAKHHVVSEPASDKPLLVEEHIAPLQEVTTWRKDSAILSKTRGIGSDPKALIDVRVQEMVPDACGRLATTILPGIEVNEPETEVSVDKLTRPVRKVDLKKTTIYHSNGKPLVEKDEADRYTFHCYDRFGNRRLLIEPGGKVTQYEHDVLGRCVKETHYEKPLKLDLSNYLTIGLGIADALPHLVAASDDREITYDYDLRDHETQRSLPITLKALTHMPGTLAEQLQMAPTITKTYPNAFNEPALIEEVNGSRIHSTRKFYDQKGNLGLTVDAKGYPTVYVYDQSDREVRKIEINQILTISDWSTATLATLLPKVNALFDKKRDIMQIKVFDRMGRVIAEGLAHQVFQKLQQVEGSSCYELVDEPEMDALTQKQYDKRGLLIKVALPDSDSGSKQYFFYNEMGWQIGETEVLRTSEDKDFKPKSLRPYKYILLNGHQNKLGMIHYEDCTLTQGTLPAGQGTHQTRLQCVDNRGLAQVSQDGNEAKRYHTYWQDRQVARAYWVVTNPDQVNGQMQEVKALHLEVMTYALRGQPLLKAVSLGAEVHQQAYRYNGFDEVIALGPGDGTWPEYQLRDGLGAIWLTNKKDPNAETGGVPTIHLRDALGIQTLTLRTTDIANEYLGPSDDFLGLPTGTHPSPTVSQLSDVIPYVKARDYQQYQAWIRELNELGHIVRERFPQYHKRKENMPLPMHTSVCVGTQYPDLGKLSFSWPDDGEHELEPRLTLWRVGENAPKRLFADPDSKLKGAKVFPLKKIKHTTASGEVHGRYGVDLSAIDPPLSADEYRWELAYFPIDPSTGGTVTYATYKATGTLPIDTGHYEGCLKPISYVDRQRNVLIIAGKTDDVKGVRITMPDGTTQDRMASDTDVVGRKEVDLTDLDPDSYSYELFNGTVTPVKTLTPDDYEICAPKMTLISGYSNPGQQDHKMQLSGFPALTKQVCVRIYTYTNGDPYRSTHEPLQGVLTGVSSKDTTINLDTPLKTYELNLPGNGALGNVEVYLGDKAEPENLIAILANDSRKFDLFSGKMVILKSAEAKLETLKLTLANDQAIITKGNSIADIQFYRVPDEIVADENISSAQLVKIESLKMLGAKKSFELTSYQLSSKTRVQYMSYEGLTFYNIDCKPSFHSGLWNADYLVESFRWGEVYPYQQPLLRGVKFDASVNNHETGIKVPFTTPYIQCTSPQFFFTCNTVYNHPGWTAEYLEEQLGWPNDPANTFFNTTIIKENPAVCKHPHISERVGNVAFDAPMTFYTRIKNANGETADMFLYQGMFSVYHDKKKFKTVPNESEESWGEYYQYPNAEVLFFAPLPDNVAEIAFEYEAYFPGAASSNPETDKITFSPLNMRAEWVPIDKSKQNRNKFGITLDVRGMEAGHYRYRFKALDADNKEVELSSYGLRESDGFYYGETDIGTGGNFYVPDNKDINEEAVEVAHLELTHQPDRWGNALETCQYECADGVLFLTAVEQYTFTSFQKPKTKTIAAKNSSGLEVREPVEVTDEHGNTVVADALTTTFGYNRHQHGIGQQDAEGYTEGNLLDEADQATDYIDGAGRRDRQVFTAFGRIWRMYNANLKKPTDMEYDLENNVLSHTDAMGRRREFKHNEDKKLTCTTVVCPNSGNEVSYHQWGLSGLTGQFNPSGTYNRMSNDHLGNMLTLAKSDGHTQSKGWDYHGNQQWWVDESGARIRDFRNLNQALREQIGEEHSWTDADGKTVTVPGRWLKYVLDELDQAIAILNVADGEALTQGFGVDGKIMQMRLVGPDGLLYQDVYVKQNAAGWLIELRDLGIGMAIGWDGRGNRRFTVGNAVPITYDADTGQTFVGEPKRINIERWNTFDGGNLLKVFGGKLNPDTKVIEVAPGQGEALEYDEVGRRKHVTTQDDDGKVQEQTLTHNDDGALATTKGPGNKHSERGFDDAGRRNYYKDEKGWQKTLRKDGRVVGFQSEGDGVRQETNYISFVPGSDDVLTQQTDYHVSQGTIHDSDKHSYVYADGACVTSISGKRSFDGGKEFKSNITHDESDIRYGANMDGPTQTSHTANASYEKIVRHPDAGTILHTVKLPRSSGPDTEKRVTSVVSDSHTGNIEAIITNEKPDNDTGEAEPDDKTHIKFTGVSGTDRSAPAGLDRIFVKQKEDLTSVIQNVLSTTSMQAVVKLALANGMTPDDVAPGYMPLTIPADLFENNQNNFKTFKHLTEDLVGTLLPSHTMPTIEPKHKHHGFGFIQGLEIAVGVALAAMIPALAGHIAALDSGLLAAGGSAAAGWDAGIEAYAIAGAITSGAASIGNSMLEGKGIHWDMVGRQMVVGAMTAAAGYKLQAFGFGATKAASVDATKAAEAVQGVSGVQVVAGEVLKGTAISLIQQTTAQMVGLIKHIDFEQVAVAAAASGGRAVAQSAMLSSASTKIQTAFTSKGQLPFEMIMMSNFAGAVSEGAMEHMLSGNRVYWDQKFYQSLASSAGELAGQYGNDKFTIQKQSEAHQAKTLKADAPQRAKASGSVLQARERRQQQYVDAKRQAAARRQQVLARHSMKNKQAAARADARGPGGGTSPFGGYTVGGSLADARFAAAFDNAMSQSDFHAPTYSSGHWYSGVVNDVGAVEAGLVDVGSGIYQAFRHPIDNILTPLGDVVTDLEVLHSGHSINGISVADARYNMHARVGGVQSYMSGFANAMAYGDLPTKIYATTRVGASFGAAYVGGEVVGPLGRVVGRASMVGAKIAERTIVGGFKVSRDMYGRFFKPMPVDLVGVASDRLQFEKLRTVYRQKTTWKKPVEIKNQHLQGIVSDLYREDASVGSGSTADAARVETSNPGLKIGNADHVGKAQDYLKALNRVVKTQNLTPHEQMIAENVRLDLLDSLGEKLWYSQTNTPKL